MMPIRNAHEVTKEACVGGILTAGKLVAMSVIHSFSNNCDKILFHYPRTSVKISIVILLLPCKYFSCVETRIRRYLC